MKPIRHVVALMTVAALGGGAAFAQSAPSPTPSPPQASTSPPLTIDTPIEALVAVPSAKAVLDADIPGLTEHPMFGQFKRDNLRVLATKFGGAISDKDLAKVQSDLASLPPATASR